jgi:hypothetical protein
VREFVKSKSSNNLQLLNSAQIEFTLQREKFTKKIINSREGRRKKKDREGKEVELPTQLVPKA